MAGSIEKRNEDKGLSVEVRRIAAVLTLALSLLTLAGASAEIVDRIVANVNGKIILLSEVRKQIDLIKKLTPPGEDIVPDDKLSEREVLMSMVDEKIIAHYATESNVTVKESEIDQAVDRVIERNKISFDQLQKALEHQGMTIGQYRDKLRDQMLIQKITGLEISGVSVTDDEVKDYYDRNKDKFMDPPEEKIRVSHIVLLASEEAYPEYFESAKSKINELMDKVRAGADFTELAKKESQDGAAPNGGDLGWFKKGMMVPEFEKTAFSLKEGEVGGPVLTQYGFHLIKVTGRIVPKPLPFEKVAEEARGMLQREAFERKRNTWMDRLRSQAYIEILY